MIEEKLDLSKPLTYVRYGRMSSEEQNPRSPDQQYDEIERVKERLGYPWILLKSYRDDGISGRYTNKRPGFQQMLSDIRSREIRPDLITVDTWERSGRSNELETIRRELREIYGVLMLTADSGFSDPTTVSGRALAFVEQLRATEDNRVKSHNVVRGKRDAVKQKLWPGGSPPLGFKLESRVVSVNGRENLQRYPVEDPATSPVVRLIFETARRTGFGVIRLVKALNADPRVPDAVKPLRPPRVRNVLSNRLYLGEMVYSKNSTDIVNDRHIIRENDPKDVLVVADFCQPLIERDLFDAVQELIHIRGQTKQALAAGKARIGSKKLIAPLLIGVALKYPLTGLCRCGECGRSMRPVTSGRTSKAGKIYTYYACPAAIHGECKNKCHFREETLRNAVWDRIRVHLFPPADGSSTGNPAWITEVIDLVRQELVRRGDLGSDHRAALDREQQELNNRQNGWLMTMGNPELDAEVRADVEGQYSAANRRIRVIKEERNALQHQQQRVADLAEPGRVIDCLRKLEHLMGGENASATNVELARHIERIDLFADRTVVMRTCKLGVLEGAIQLLSRRDNGHGSASIESALHQPGDSSEADRWRQFPLPQRQSVGWSEEQGKATSPALTGPAPDRFDGLDLTWFWEERWVMQGVICWSSQHADEVARFARENPMSVIKLAAHFKVAKQTIRSALKQAKEASAKETVANSPAA